MNTLERIIMWSISIAFMFLSLFIIVYTASAEPIIDMEVIKMIESSGNPQAYNPHSQARGLYQITPICLKEYNNHHKHRYNIEQLFDADVNYEIADWYMNIRLVQLLKYYKIPVTVDNLLISYNFGIGNLRKGKQLPKETREYIRKYNQLTKGYEGI